MPGRAAAAASKGQQLGTCRRWVKGSDEAREHGRKGGIASAAKRWPKEATCE